jgi:hypothetical protein
MSGEALGGNSAMDKQTFRRKYVLGLMARPETLLSGVVGFTLLVGSWALGLGGNGAVFAGVASLFGCGGLLMTRIIMGDSAAAAQAIDEMQREALEARTRRLDALEDGLEHDDDPRTQGLLRELRGMAKDFETVRSLDTEFDVGHAFDIAWNVEELFRQGVESLERSLKLWETARGMATERLRQNMMARRERLIQDVQESLKRLGDVLVTVNELGTCDKDLAGAARIRAELDQQLEVARRVSRRMNSLDGSEIEEGDYLSSSHAGRET